MPQKPQQQWYGWQVLTAVGASDTLFIAGAASGGGTGSSVLLGTGIVGHLLSGAAVHFAHRNWKMGGASIGLNVGAPLVLGLTGVLVGALACAAGAGKDSEFGCLAAVGFGGAGGLILGGMTATILDSAVFAYEPLPPPRAQSARAMTPTFTLIPLLGPGRSGLSLAGQF